MKVVFIRETIAWKKEDEPGGIHVLSYSAIETQRSHL